MVSRQVMGSIKPHRGTMSLKKFRRDQVSVKDLFLLCGEKNFSNFLVLPLASPKPCFAALGRI